MSHRSSKQSRTNRTQVQIVAFIKLTKGVDDANALDRHDVLSCPLGGA